MKIKTLLTSLIGIIGITAAANAGILETITPNGFYIEGGINKLNTGDQIYAQYETWSNLLYTDMYVPLTVENKFSFSGKVGIDFNINGYTNLEVSYSKLNSFSSDENDKEYALSPYITNLALDEKSAEFNHSTNIIDTDVVKTKKFDDKFTFNYSAGLKLINYKRDVVINATGFFTSHFGPFIVNDTIETLSKLNAAGPKVSAGLDYKIGRSFSVFGNMGVSLVAGNLSINRLSTHSGSFDISETTIVPIFSNDIGVKWAQESGKYYVKLGYRAENWKNSVVDAIYSEGDFSAIQKAKSDFVNSSAYIRFGMNF